MPCLDPRRVILRAVPDTVPRPEDFEVIEATPQTTLEDGQVRVRACLFGLNAGLRSRLGTGRSTTFGPAIGIGDTPESDAVAVVTASAHPGFSTGDTVVGSIPWTTSAQVQGGSLRRIDPGSDPLRHLTILGHVGRTAWVGLVTVGRLAPGQTVWISAAAGGVGTCAVQFAQRLGARVIASASGAERLAYLSDTLGVDAVMDRRRDLPTQLGALAPDGIDLYLDSVGGEHLTTALAALRNNGTAVLAGRVGGSDHLPVLHDTSLLIRKRLSLKGFSVTDHPGAQAEVEQFAADADNQPDLRPVATVRLGIDNLPEAFCDLFAGGFIGRGVVEVGSQG